MTLSRAFACLLPLGLSLGLAGCGGSKCAEAPSSTRTACSDKSVPAGRWTGEWESSPLSQPDFSRSGSIDLVVSDNGTLVGQTIEHYNGYAGELSGTVRAGGEFRGEYLVSRDGGERRYQVKGNFACDSDGLTGKGVVTWGSTSDRGSLSFQMHQAN